MDRKILIQLLRDGMQCPPGRHRFWVSRCFEITVRPDKRVVELDEYESFATEDGSEPARRRSRASDCKEMFHVGKSDLHLKDGQVLEESGGGWRDGSTKRKRS